MSTTAAAPTLGPTGSCAMTAMAMSTAVASNSDASTPTAWSISQLRTICDTIAIDMTAIVVVRPCMWVRTARPVRQPSPWPRESFERSFHTRATTTSTASGTHHGRPSGPTSVKKASAPNAASMTRMGASAAMSAGTRGASSGCALRSTAMRAAVPTWALSWLPR